MGMDLYKAFVEAGLPEPTLHFEAPMGGPEDWPGYEYLANSFRSLVPCWRRTELPTAEALDVDTLAEADTGGSRCSETTDYVATAYHGVCHACILKRLRAWRKII